MDIKFETSTSATKSTHVIFAHKADKKIKVDGAIKTWVEALEKSGTFEAKLSEAKLLRARPGSDEPNTLVVGLGEKGSLSADSARRAMATVTQILTNEKFWEASVFVNGLSGCAKDSEYLHQAVAEGVGLASYKFTGFKSEDEKQKKDKEKEVLSLEIVGGKAKDGLESGSVVAKWMNFARRLGDTPPNYMTPEIFAKEIQDAAKGTKVKVSVWDRAKIKKEKFGGLYGVGLGSENEPRFIIMEYKGGGSKKTVAFVGKGLTFDAGGISIKPADGMDEMRYDMCGGTNVAATVLAIAEMGLKINVTGYISATENMLGPMANKPGDILTARNGKTMEVLNTDAEGRLVLADALAYASEQKPAAIIDAATLTGAVVVALGYVYTAFFTRNDKLKSQILDSADKADELVWQMPIHDEYVKEMKGHYGDFQNISKTPRSGGSCTAAAFLEQFVGEGIPWVHFDIAGTAWHTGKFINYNPGKGASGVMIRTFIELAQTLS